MTNTRLIYVTTANADEARAIGETVVRERLAACANILPAVQSVYWWEGAVETDSESVLILKTASGRVADLTARIRALHSYDTPCVVALEIDGGNQDFIDWIEAETRTLE
jgi:periplasmic divalent cation tolerance protein